MNPNRQVCSCGVAYDEGRIDCANCGAALAPSNDGVQAQAPVADDATVPMVTASAGPENDEGYALGTILGSYRLIRQIGSGGMGRVFIAEHTRLGRQVALKVLRSEYSDNVEAIKRFFAEAQAVNRINHENIIEVSDFIENSSGASFYIMELLKGVDLHTLETREGVLPLPRALKIAIQVCRGLGAAHDAHIVHRDLKPDNVFLVERGGRTDFVKLLDFGIAKLMNDALDAASRFKSTAGLVIGTPDYMSPEQALGQPVDHRADIYAMGMILFEMVTGRMPFQADSAREIMVKHMMVTPPRPNRFRSSADPLPFALEEVILACLEKEPRDRPQSIKEVENRLESILASLPRSTAPKALARTWRDKRVWLAGGVTLVALIGLVSLARRGSTSAASPPVASSVAEAARTPRPRVQITFGSTPAGASVFRVGDARPLGVTPFAAAFESSPRSQMFEFRLDGWKVGRTQLVPLGDTHAEVSLEPAAAERKPGGASGSTFAATEGPEPRPAAGKRTGPGKRPERAPADSAPPGPLLPPETPAPPRARKLDHDAVLNPFE